MYYRHPRAGGAPVDDSIAQRIAAERLAPLRFHPEQHRLVTSGVRFAVVPAGRRSGKTERAKRKLVRCLLESVNETRWADPRFFAAAPTRDQAKKIFWADLKAMIRPEFLAEPPRETELSIKTKWGASILIVGLDKPQRIEGVPWDGGVVDEIANVKPNAWPENIRPSLSDRHGWCWLIGVPEGRNHYYDLWKTAIAKDRDGNPADPEWDGFTWYSEDILDPAEIASAKRHLDELTFNQEYRADFVSFTGRAYYPFTDKEHTGRKLTYNSKAPLIFCFDFNVDPGVSVVCQEQTIPKEYERDAHGVMQLDRPVSGTGVIGEVYIPQNSNTPAVCRKLIADWGEHQGEVRCYGDATGRGRGTAQTEGSDWDLIKRDLGAHFGDRLEIRVNPANPTERARINAMNSRLKAADGTVRMQVDSSAAPYTVKDLEGVRLLKGGSGEIDKKYDLKLTHLSDALGYYIEKEFPTRDTEVSIVYSHRM